MVKRISLSNDHLGLDDISIHHSDSESSLKLYFTHKWKDYEKRFDGYTAEDLISELRIRIDELNHTSSLSLLSAIEAAFRIDYLQRNYKKRKDPLSRDFRAIYRQKNLRASLEEDIFDTWKANANGASQIISDLKGAFKYRHWLAHGRYWEPKFGRPRYDYDTVYEMTEIVFNSFPFEGV